MSASTRTPPQTAPRAKLVSVDGKVFPLRSAAITARAEGGLADTRLVQTYENPHAEPLEVVYTMPLPADGAVVGYTITLGDRVITGEIERLEKAREAYQRALEEGRTAGLLEQVRADTFTQKLGSLPAGATARIEIRVLHPLAYRAAAADETATWEYRFPTVVGVRYQGAPGRVPDADKLDVDRADECGTPVRLELDLLLADGAPDALAPASRTHGIRVAAADDGCAVSLDEGAPLDRDVIVTWQAATDEVGVRLVEGPGLPQDDGRYALLTITPPAKPEATMHRDLTVLIDASGSMTGEPLESCKDVVRALLESLGPDDRFEILAFASYVTTLIKGPAKASPTNVQQALDRLEALEAGGATEMRGAIIKALTPLRRDAQRQVILLTDGDIGFEGEVVGEIAKRLKPGCRVHTVGVGYAPNRTLTRGAARAGRGCELLVLDGTDASSSAKRLLQATVGPVLTDLSVTGSACSTVAPHRPRDVLSGQPLVVAVALEPDGGTVEVRGRLAGSRADWVRTVDVSAATPDTTLPIGALFGREAVEDQELVLVSTRNHREHEGIVDAIEALGLRHRITTRRTSLVAIADEPTVDPKAPRRRHRLEVELPAGVSAEGVGLRRAGVRYFADPSVSAELGIYGRSAQPYRPRPRRIMQLPGVGAQKMRLPADGSELLGPPGPQGLLELTGRVARVQDDLLVVELEAPEDGFFLPDAGDEIRVTTQSGIVVRAAVDGDVSTRPGPHDRGMTLRLGLRLTDEVAWPDGELRIIWPTFEGPRMIRVTNAGEQG